MNACRREREKKKERRSAAVIITLFLSPSLILVFFILSGRPASNITVCFSLQIDVSSLARSNRRTQNSNYNKMREIVHIQAGQCGNQIGSKVRP